MKVSFYVLDVDNKVHPAFLSEIDTPVARLETDQVIKPGDLIAINSHPDKPAPDQEFISPEDGEVKSYCLEVVYVVTRFYRNSSHPTKHVFGNIFLPTKGDTKQ